MEDTLNQAFKLLGRREYQQAMGLIIKYLANFPNSDRGWVGLAACFYGMKELGEAARCFREAVDINPQNHSALIGLAAYYGDMGDLSEAQRYSEAATKLSPESLDYDRIHSHILAAQSTDPYEIKRIYAKHGAIFFNDLASQYAALDPSHYFKGKPKIGYVSGDLRNHSVAHFMRPIFDHHDYEKYDIFVFSTMAEDHVSELIKKNPLKWINIQNLNDEDTLWLIRGLKIDILIDLSGHTAGNRLRVFSMRAAPIQATWLGFMHTLGLSAIDWRITDGSANPEGTDDHFVEKLYRFDCMAAYSPPNNLPIQAEPPVLKNNFFTLACLNHSRKLSDDALILFSKIVNSRPNLKLLLIGSENSQSMASHNIGNRLERLNIKKDNIEIISHMSLEAFMQLGSRVDLALDSFPTSGGTTTMHCLWMGLPMVALESEVSANNTTASTLRGLQLDELVASSFDQYYEKTMDLIDDIACLAEIRSKTREKLLNSPLMAYQDRVRELENFFDFSISEYKRQAGSVLH